jgi:tetratricopeptide (TPR) repeat protein
MKGETFFKDKLEHIIFLEVSETVISETFKTKTLGSQYIPINTSAVIEKVKNGIDLSEIPVSLFYEAMIIVLCCNKTFQYNELYVRILKNNFTSACTGIKKKVYELVKCGEYIDAYILLKGYLTLDINKDNFDKLLWLACEIYKSNTWFKDEAFIIIEEAKQIPDYITPFYFEAEFYYAEGNFRSALDSLCVYLQKGGNETSEITQFKRKLQISVDYEVGKEMVREDPKSALKLLLPLLEETEANPLLYYHIGMAYRVFGLYEKAIYYLNESVAIDSSYAEVINELGLSYACLNDFSNAALYFKKAFEATKSVEICTNLISCFISMKDYKQAKVYFETAKKINSNDEILIKLGEIIEGDNNGIKGVH